MTTKEKPGEMPEPDDIVFVEANWKMEMLRNTWFGMCSVEFSEPFVHLNTTRGFPLSNPTHLRCAIFSSIMAIELVGSFAELREFLQGDPKRMIIIITANGKLNYLLNQRTGNKEGLLISRLQNLIKTLPANIKYEYFAETAEDKERKKGNVASIKGDTSLMTAHTVVFEDPKKYKEEVRKKKDEKDKDPKKMLEKTQHVREQDLLIQQLMESGARPSRSTRRPV